VLLFVPVFNVDGHERFAKWNRPNQRGPVEMGWRTTAQNFNLNRDYVKADAPEMQAMLALVNKWDPLTYVDLHVTDGAMFQHDVSIQVEPVYSGDPEFRKAGLALRSGNVIQDITKQGSSPQSYYMSFKETTTRPRASSTACPTRASRPAISSCATAWPCWSRPIRGRIIRPACASPTIPSSRC
jgi:hypothetical protein